MTGVTGYQFFLCHLGKYTSIVFFRDKYSSACSIHEISYKFPDSHLTVYVEESVNASSIRNTTKCLAECVYQYQLNLLKRVSVHIFERIDRLHEVYDKLP